jgi:uncharacterized membrane protein (DUF4010 family)
MPNNPIHALLVSASLGALLGLVRQWEYEHGHPGETAKAGLRTFTAWSLFGCAAGILAQATTPMTLALSLAAFTLIMGAVHIADGEKETLGLTTFSISLVTFALGALAAYAEYEAAMVLGVGAMLILGSKTWSHAWTRRWQETDLRSLLQFAAITGLVLPLAPNEDMGPEHAFNPFKIWLMVVYVAGLGFFGYVAIRWLGERAGIFLTGLAGGLASSTATTVSMSRQSKTAPTQEASFALAALLACTVMLVRLLVLLVTVDVTLAGAMILPFVGMAVPSIVVSIMQWRRAARVKNVDAPKMNNPLSLTLALKFGVLYAVVGFLVKFATNHLSAGWVYVVSFVSGLEDAAPITLSTAHAVSTGALSLPVAARCVLLGALANTLMKAVLAAAFGSSGFRRAIGWSLGAVFVAGTAALFLF